MTITLTPDLEHTLTERAERQGTTPELLALRDLHELYKEERQPEDAAINHGEEKFAGQTLADVLVGRIGTIRSSEYTGIKSSHLSEDEVAGLLFDEICVSVEEVKAVP